MQRERRGNTVIEMTLMAPWLFFLFVGVFDFGYYAYALISVENAARVAAMNMSATSSSWASAKTVADAAACVAVSQELASMPNSNAFPAGCNDYPLKVTTAALDGTTTPLSADNTRAASVTVTYQTVPLIPIPGLLMSQYTFTRNVQMRVRGS